MFCNGIVNCHSMGLGGGFLMTIYSRSSKKAYSLVAREVAPLSAYEGMFRNDSQLSKNGGLAVGVPGELKGYWEAWKKFGRLKWEEVMEPSLELCRDGYHMTKHLYHSLEFHPNVLVDDAILRETFTDPATGNKYLPGTLIKPKKICDTLQLIAIEGGNAMHNGSLTKLIVEDVKEHGGIISEEDFINYKVEWTDPVTVKLHGGETVYSMPPPGCGVLLTYILSVMDGYNLTAGSISNTSSTVLTIHRMIEAFKFAFARRTELGDPDFVDINELLRNLTSKEFVEDTCMKIQDNQTSNNTDYYGAVFYSKEDHGTSHISVLSEDGDAVAVTSTINLYLGAGFTSKQTGIILNSVMDDFSEPGVKNYYGIPPSPNNFISPKKRPISSACPTVVVDSNGEVKLVIGAAGGTRIISAVTWVIMRYLWFGENLKQAIDASRVHHQLYPMEIKYEYGFLDSVIKGLRKLGHQITRYQDIGSVVSALAKSGGKVYGNSDFRKGGEIYGMD